MTAHPSSTETARNRSRGIPTVKALILAAIGFGCIVATEPVNATGLCAEIEFLVQHAERNFLHKTNGDTQAKKPERKIPLHMTGASDCAIALSISGAKIHHCRWNFAYRSRKAFDTFDRLKQSIRNCAGATVSSAKDQKVNHPDSYDQQDYSFGPVQVAVSLKDKGALGSTHLFIRVHGTIQIK